METIQFKSKLDNKEFVLKVPNAKDIENNEFIEINGKQLIAEEIMVTDEDYGTLSENARERGELVYSLDEIYDLYYYNGEFYDFYWDTASGCIFSRLKKG